MNNNTKTISSNLPTESLLNLDEIINRFQNNDHSQTVAIGDVIYSEKVQTSQLFSNQKNQDYKNNYEHNTSYEQQIKDINQQLDHLNNKFINTKQTLNHNNVSPPPIHPPKPPIAPEKVLSSSINQLKSSTSWFLNKKQEIETNYKVESNNLNNLNKNNYSVLNANVNNNLNKDPTIKLNKNLFENTIFEKVETDNSFEPTKKKSITDKIVFNVGDNKNEKKKHLFKFLKTKETSLNQIHPQVCETEKNKEYKDQKETIKQLKNKIPRFYKFELFVSTFWLVVNILFFCCTLATLGLALWNIFVNGLSYWILLPQTVANFVTLIGLMLTSINLRSAKKELKINNYEINREVISPFIKKKYRSIITFNILMNWYSFGIYLLWGVGILLTFIITYFVNLINFNVNDFGNLVINSNNIPMIIIIVFGVLIGLTFILQMISLVFNKKRQNEIDIYYQKNIIEDEMVLKYKKSANKKGMIIFFTITFALTFTILFTWFFLKRRAKKSLKA